MGAYLRAASREAVEISSSLGRAASGRTVGQLGVGDKR
jgi:hypothetical protein